MAEHREKVDRRLSLEIVKRVLIPLCLDLGARYIRHPYLGNYNDEDKTIKWGIGHKKHGDKRHRTHATFTGIVYRDGKKTEGETRSIEVDRRIGWSRKHDNRLVANEENVNVKIASFNETFNRLRTFTSFDLIQRFSGIGQGRGAGHRRVGYILHRGARAYGRWRLRSLPAPSRKWCWRITSASPTPARSATTPGA